MKILLLNQDWFAKDFREAGHEVVCIGFGANTDVVYKNPLSQVKNILPDGFEPELVLIHDNSACIQARGLHELECPMIFYGVDTHLHTDFHCQFSQTVNQTFIAHKDYIKEFERLKIDGPEWLPVWAGTYLEPQEPKKYDVSFVGTLDPEINPERVAFFSKLKNLVNIHLLTGDYRTIFPFSEVVINQTLKSDLNFRTFEAMMSGAALLTERIDNGLTDLFEPNEDLMLYDRNNAEEASEMIRLMLGDRNKCKKIARSGREKVLNFHTQKHRARKILDMIPEIKTKPKKLRYFPWMYNFQMLCTQMDNKTHAAYSISLEEAMKLLHLGLRHAEPVNDHLAVFAIRTCDSYDKLTNKKLGRKILHELSEAYPQCKLFQMARMHNVRQIGDTEELKKISQNLFGDADVSQTGTFVEQKIRSILSWPN